MRRKCNDAAAFVAFRQQGEERFHLVAGLLDVADVVEDDHFVGVEAAQFTFEQQVALGAQEFVHQAKGGGEENAVPGLDELVSHSGREVSLSNSGQSKDDSTAKTLNSHH